MPPRFGRLTTMLLLGLTLWFSGCVPGAPKITAADLSSDTTSTDSTPSTDADASVDLSPETDQADPSDNHREDGHLLDLSDTQVADFSDVESADSEDGGTKDIGLKKDIVFDSGPDVGNVPADYPEGILGAPPAGNYLKVCDLQIKNDRTIKRPREIAWSGVPMALDDNITALDRLVLVDEQGRHVQAQFNVLSRWKGALDKKDDISRPIRWLQVSTQLTVDAESTRTLELRYYDTPPGPPADPDAVQIVKDGALWKVTTGPAEFLLNPHNPGLLEQVGMDFKRSGTFTTVYTHKSGAGPRMLTGAGSVIETFDSYPRANTTATGVYVDDDPKSPGQPYFQIVERGPVRVVVILRGHFVRAQEKRDCTDNNFADLQDPFGFTVAMTFTRGMPHIDLKFIFRNECGSGELASFLDESTEVDLVSWEFPLPWLGNSIHYSSTGTSYQTPIAFDGTVIVAQSKGRLNDQSQTWESDAYIKLDYPSQADEFPQRDPFLTLPWVAVRGNGLIVGLQMPWMRYREPQALTASKTGLSLQFVSEPLKIGEGKGIWNAARISFAPAELSDQLDLFFNANLATLERGLLIRLPLAQFNRTKVYPSLGNSALVKSKLKQNYALGITSVHGMTLGYPVINLPSEPGQWKRALTFGSQLWPDIPEHTYDLDHKTPYDYRAYLNSGSPMGAEFLEFYRTGEPKWVWDFAMPQAWLMLFTGWYNTGRQNNWLNGFAVNLSGIGEGDWHRRDGDQFSQGATYLMGIADAFVLRPSPLLLDRIAEQGKSTPLYYNLSKVLEGQRSWWNKIELFQPSNEGSYAATGLALIQHLEALSNCSEFLPGQIGKDCLTQLTAIMNELVSDNLVDGAPCNGDIAPTSVCEVGSLFTYVYGFAQVSWRYIHSLNPDNSDGVKQMLLGVSRSLMDKLIPRTQGGDLDIGGDWRWSMSCIVDNGSLKSCTPLAGSAFAISGGEMPQVLALPLIALQLDSSFETYCDVLKTAFADDALYAEWLDRYDSDVFGWDVPSSFLINSLVFAVGGLDLCP